MLAVCYYDHLMTNAFAGIDNWLPLRRRGILRDHHNLADELRVELRQPFRRYPVFLVDSGADGVDVVLVEVAAAHGKRVT